MALLDDERNCSRTALTRKLTLDGVTMTYPVYAINLDKLFYNDQNDRIATWISEYRADHNGHSPDPTEREAYNEIIEDFIVKSNHDAIRKTQTNIELVNQREPGVVLNDGRIIDGNRRFTCLRRLFKEGKQNFARFEAIILDRDIQNDQKQIKMLELSIQHGEESKVEYNPVDRLAGIYNDIIDSRLLTEEEYARCANESVSDVRRRVEVAELMVEFLDFINAPKQFHIARDLQIYYPIEELAKAIKICKSKDDVEDLKTCCFSNILMQPYSDMTRYIRNIKGIVSSAQKEEFFREQNEIADRVVRLLPAEGSVNSQIIRDTIRSNNSLVEEMNRSMEKAKTKAQRGVARTQPISLAEKAADVLESVDQNIFEKMNVLERKHLSEQLARLEFTIAEMKGKLQ